MGKNKLTVVDDEPNGMYIWLYKGNPVGDDDGNYMAIVSKRGDRSKIKQLEDAARHYGVFEDGAPQFLGGRRPVTDEEYEEQRMRQKMGLVPDPLESSF